MGFNHKKLTIFITLTAMLLAGCSHLSKDDGKLRFKVNTGDSVTVATFSDEKKLERLDDTTFSVDGSDAEAAFVSDSYRDLMRYEFFEDSSFYEEDAYFGFTGLDVQDEESYIVIADIGFEHTYLKVVSYESKEEAEKLLSELKFE